MLMHECQGKPKPELIEVTCPKCGELVEMMSTDVVESCEICGATLINDAFSCALWCDQAEKCLGKDIVKKVKEHSGRIRISDADLRRLLR